tara:strand:+ start:265480 stop:266298 length:819 start_codon:yes stop_codon:yes gene_type:complete
MLKSLWIKLPTILLAALAVVMVDGPLAWWLAGGFLLLGTAILLFVVCSVRSSFLVTTRWRAVKATNSVALTFDDGPDTNFTARVLDILAEHDVPAAFFVVGHRVRAHPELLVRAHAEGHVIGNHTESHSLLFHCRLWATLRREIVACNEAIQATIGIVPTMFRSPHGFKNPALADVLKQMSMTVVGWQVRGCDAVSNDPQAIEARVVDAVQPGGVILLHDGSGLGGAHDRSATLTALPAIIRRLRAKGLHFARLDELLGVKPYRPQQQLEAS